MSYEVFTCGNCGKSVSKNSLKCPHCGVQFGGVRNKNSFENRPRTYVRCKVCGQTSIWYTANPKQGQCHHCLNTIDRDGNLIRTLYEEGQRSEKYLIAILIIFIIIFLISLINSLLCIFVYNNFAIDLLFVLGIGLPVIYFIFFIWLWYLA